MSFKNTGLYLEQNWAASRVERPAPFFLGGIFWIGFIGELVFWKLIGRVRALQSRIVGRVVRRSAPENPTKNPSKIARNASKFIQKYDRIRWKREVGAKTRQECLLEWFFLCFFEFFENPGPPKIEPKSLKIPKNRFQNHIKTSDKF